MSFPSTCRQGLSLPRSNDTAGEGEAGGGRLGPPRASQLIWKGAGPFLSLQVELGCRDGAAGAERGSPAKECDISEAAATSGEGAEGAQRAGGCAGRDGTGEGGDATAPARGRGRLGERAVPAGPAPRPARSRCRGAGRAWGCSRARGVSATLHRALGEWRLGEQEPESQPKYSPSLAHSAATFGAAARGGRHRTGRHLDWGVATAPAPQSGTQHPQTAGRGRRRAQRTGLG